MRVVLRPLLALAWSAVACRDPVVLPDTPSPTDASDVARDIPVVDTPSNPDDGVGPDTPTIDTIADNPNPVDTPDVPVAMDTGIDAGTDAGADTATDSGSDVVTPSEAGDAGPPLLPDLIPERRVTCGPRTRSPSMTAGVADRFVLRGRVVTPTAVIPNGEVFITGSTITCAAVSCASSPQYAGSTVIETGGIIYPGFVDAHNHTAYDFLPPWMTPRLYNSHGQWQGSTAYMTFVAPYRTATGTPDHTCAVGKYGEIRALMGGTTSIQGSPSNRCITRTLVRNIEAGPDFNSIDVVRTNVLGIDTVDATQAASIRMQMDSGQVRAYIIHLSEGIDEPTRMEFDDLVSKNLLTSATVVVHGTAFGANEFRQLGMAGGKLVWSPRSNVILYGRTTDIPTALANNISVSLAPDWTPSGGPTMFAEMRYARYVSQTKWGGLLSNRDLFEMTTIRPARATARETYIGSIEAGKQADLLVLPDCSCDAYDAFVDGTSADLVMVMIGGKPLYGDMAIMNALPATLQANCEDFTACGMAKRVCVSKGAGAPDLTGQTLAEIDTEIRTFFTPYPLVPHCP